MSLKEFLFEEDIICGECRHKFIENRKVYHLGCLKIHAFYEYDEFIEGLLFQFKEGRDIALKDVFLYKKRNEMRKIFKNHKCVIMPSSEEKIKTRGFVHLEKMLECCDIECIHCFSKNKNYKQSSSKNRKKVKDVIELIHKPSVPYYLFDDVVTSGNTLLAAASLLEEDEIEVYAYSVHPHFIEMCTLENDCKSV